MSEPKIVVRNSGPLLVTGVRLIEDVDGNPFRTDDKETVALCRCGASGNRPFCDGSHRECGFDAVDRAGS